MATAPRPGGSRSADPRSFIRLRVREDSYDIRLALTIQEKVQLRLQVGLPFEAFFKTGQDTFGEDSLVVLWWLGRRQADEPTLGFEQAANEWSALELGEKDIDLEVVELTAEVVDDNPE